MHDSLPATQAAKPKTSEEPDDLKGKSWDTRGEALKAVNSHQRKAGKSKIVSIGQRIPSPTVSFATGFSSSFC